MNNTEGYNALLECLVLFTKLYHKPHNAETLIAGLPVEQSHTAPELFSLKSSKSLFSRAAKRAGLSSRLVKKSLDDISPLVLPAILVLKNERACILESIDLEEKTADIILPETGEAVSTVSLKDLEKEYLGYAFYLKKTYEYHSKQHKLIEKKEQHWFWGTIRHSKPFYRDVLIVSIAINLFMLALPLFTMNIYDRVVPNSAFDTLWVLSIGILGVLVLDGIMKVSRSYLLELAAKKSDIIISSILFEHVMDIKMSSKPASAGSFANNLRDFDSIRGFLTTATLTGFIDIPFAVIFLIVVFIISGPIVFVPVVSIMLIVGFVMITRKPMQRSIEQTHEAAANKSSILIESLVNLETIKTLGASGHSQWMWEEATGEIANKGLKAKLLGGMIPVVTQFFTQLNTVVIIMIGVSMIDEKTLTMGGLIAATMLSSRIIGPFSQVASLISNFENTKTAYESIENIMQMEVEHPRDKKFVHHGAFNGKIEFQDVSFGYPQDDHKILHNVSFTIMPGERVAFIGKIGSGKTTVEKLMMGLYTTDQGAVMIDDIDIRQMDPATLRKQIGYVPQDIMLFKGSVKDNIVFKSPHADDTSIIRASKISNSESFINRHPKGFDMEVSERGENLSGGQRQCIALARALVDDPMFLLLDEPTNMMDNTTEQIIIQNLKQTIEGKTTIIVTHKMSLLTLVDRIIVMGNGKILADGPKEEIMKKLQGSAA